MRVGNAVSSAALTVLMGAHTSVLAADPQIAVAPATGGTTPRAQLADWHIDDMWGAYPRPSEAIGYGRPRGDGELVAAVDAVDLQFVA